MHWETAWEQQVADQHNWAETLSGCEQLVRAHPWACLLTPNQAIGAALDLATNVLDGDGRLTLDAAIVAQQQRSAA